MISLRESPDELRAIQARARGHAQVLKLPFRQQRWRGQSGGFQGTGVGSSLDFHDHRVYLPGDDPRQINWQAYARTGTYTMKLYREEVRPLVDLIFDVSESMFAFPGKERRTLELFAFCVEASLQTGAALRCYVVRGDAHLPLTAENLVGGNWVSELERLSPELPDKPPAVARLPLRAASMRVLVSDLLFPAEPDALLSPLGNRNGRGIVFAPFSLEESDPGWDGNYEFIDAETRGEHLHRVEPLLLQRYASAYARHFDLWKAASMKQGTALVRVPAEVEFQRAMQAEGLSAGAVEVGV